MRSPSTLGTFTHGQVQQLGAVGRRVLAGLAHHVPGLLAGGRETDGIAFVDVDDTIRGTYGYAKQATSYGYSRVKGLNVPLAALSTPVAAPVIASSLLRRGASGSATGAARMLTTAIRTARAAGLRSQVMARADPAYYGWAFTGAALREGAWFSVTARMTPTVTRAITSITDQTWTPIRYPRAIWEDDGHGGGYLVSDAKVAEVPFTAFTHRKKAEHVHWRLVVRRVRRHQVLESDGSVQGELFSTWRHHAFITKPSLDTVEADRPTATMRSSSR